MGRRAGDASPRSAHGVTSMSGNGRSGHAGPNAAAETPARPRRGVDWPRPPRFIPRRPGRPLAELRLVDDALPTDVQARDTLFRRLLGLADLLAGAVGLLVAVSLSPRDSIRFAALIALPAIVAMSKVIGLYDRDELLLHKATLDDAPAVFQLATLFAIFVWLLESAFIDGALGKAQFVALWGATFAFTLAGRATARWLAERHSAPERCLVLGPPEVHELVRSKLGLRASSGVELVARRDLEDEQGHMLVSGELRSLVRAHAVHRLILAPTATDSDAVLDLIREAKGLGLKISLLPRFSEVLGSSVLFDDFHGLTVLAVRRFGLSRSSRVLKRAFDVLVAGVSFAMTSPLFGLLAIAVRLDSPGPIFFRQTRIGRAGEPFQILKFRTMVREADQLKAELEHLNEANGLFKITADPRVTRVGRWLRRTSLDELPQLLNVLRGDMSLVGPRPLVLEDDRRVVGWHRERLNISPGMTGHWQVLGSSRIPLSEMVAIDYLYVVNWSLWTDLKYLLRTVPYVLGARGV